jgi:hypothetical protein
VGDCHLNFFELLQVSGYFRLERVGRCYAARAGDGSANWRVWTIALVAPPLVQQIRAEGERARGF